MLTAPEGITLLHRTRRKTVHVIDIDDESCFERLRGESQKAYNYFCVYRDMPLAERTTRKVSQNLKRNHGFIRELCARWAWVQRAEAWDLYQDEQKRQYKLEQNKKEIDGMNERQIKLALMGQRSMAQRLSQLRPEEIDPKDIPVAVEKYFKLERTARGVIGELPQTSVSINARVNTKIAEDEDDFDFSQLTREELKEFLRLHEKALRGNGGGDADQG